MVASTVPRTRARMPAKKVSWMLTQNAAGTSNSPNSDTNCWRKPSSTDAPCSQRFRGPARPPRGPPEDGSGAGGGRRGVQVLVRLVARGADVLVEQLLPGAVVYHLGDGGVDVLALVAVLGDADPVVLLRERVADDLDLALVGGHGGQAGQDDVVGGDGVDGSGGQGRDALGVPGLLEQVGARGVLVLDALRRRGPGDGAEVLALEVLGALDGVVVRGDQEVLPGDEVRTGEGHDFLALVVDRVGREDHVDLAVLQQRLALRGRRLDPLDLVLAVAELARDVLGDVDVEAGVLAAVLVAQAGLVELDADLDGALGAAAALRRVARRGSVVAAVVVAARTAGQAERGGGCESQYQSSSSHGVSPSCGVRCRFGS